MQTTYILNLIQFDGARLTLTKVDLDALPVVSGDLVELFPNGLRAFVSSRTLLSGVRAYEVSACIGGAISGPHVDLLKAHGWEPVS